MKALMTMLMMWVLAFAAAAQPAKIPVVLDTDIGDDIDDTWALAMLLRHSHFDLKMVTTTHGSAEYRAKLVCKLLTVAGRTDVAVGLGAGGRNGGDKQLAWVKDYKLTDYAGKVHEDGVQALIDLVMKSDQPVTIIGIGPTETLAEALKREPGIAPRAIFVGMQGSVRVGYGGKATPDAEWNVKCNVKASKAVFSANWKEMRITPLDTCGLIHLQGQNFARLATSQDKLAQAVLENYRIWAGKPRVSDLNSSSTLFDTVAVYLADPGKDPLFEIEELPISVDDKGFTVIDPNGRKMKVASKWKSLDGYHDLLTKVIEGTDW
ncbi:MAG: nucleoside hydrolase [Tepidisphaeraceae bacterium]|jgi:inosine-uridine nucleoside N-ribohydrolase